MITSEKDVLKAINYWNVLERKINSLEERIKGHQYKVTPSYDITGVCSSGFSNKLERYCLKDLENRENLDILLEERARYLAIFKAAPLTKLERKLIKHIAYCGKLSDFARIHKLYPPHHAKSYVYKLRDNACLKVFNSYTNMHK